MVLIYVLWMEINAVFFLGNFSSENFLHVNFKTVLTIGLTILLNTHDKQQKRSYHVVSWSTHDSLGRKLFSYILYNTHIYIVIHHNGSYTQDIVTR